MNGKVGLSRETHQDAQDWPLNAVQAHTLERNCGMRPNILCFLNNWEKQKGLQWSNCKFPSTLLLWIRYASGTTLLIKLTRHSSCFSVPSSSWNYSNKPITSSCGNQGSPHPLETTKPALHSPSLFIQLPSAAPCGLVWCAMSSSTQAMSTCD